MKKNYYVIALLATSLVSVTSHCTEKKWRYININNKTGNPIQATITYETRKGIKTTDPKRINRGSKEKFVLRYSEKKGTKKGWKGVTSVTISPVLAVQGMPSSPYVLP